MNYEMTAIPAGDAEARADHVALPEAGTEATAIDEGMTEPPDDDADADHDDRFGGADDDHGRTVEVEYEGEIYEVPLRLKDALLRQADYTRKTMELADQRRALAADRAGFEQAETMRLEEFQAAMRLHEIAAELDQLSGHDWSQLDPQDPDLPELRAIVEGLIGEQQALHGQLAQHHHYRNAREQQEMARTRAETDHAMAREIQDWSPERRQVLESFAVHLGIPEDHLGHASAAEMRILNLAFQGAMQAERQRAANRGAYRPAAEVGGGTGANASDPSRMTMDQYRAWRAKQK